MHREASGQWEIVDGNEAAADVAFRLSEVIAIYPITPASTMAELSDTWSASGRTNLWGTVPEVIEMQSEAGAAGTLHGATLRGALATSFTASQGLLLMLPNMFKIAGELSPAVIHVAARAVATHALSIFGDHSDVMAARTTGWAMLSASTVQEAADFALVAHAATLDSRVPFLHFFDGFRTSHEVAMIEPLEDADLRFVVDDRKLLDHRYRGLDPDRPVLRGSAQNPDVFFQAREAGSPFTAAVPSIVESVLERLAARTGRRYGLVDYVGAPDAERVVVLMGSAFGPMTEAVEALVASGEKVGALVVRLYRPFPAAALLAAVPRTVRSIAVLDRTKEPGAPGEPLYLDVVETLARAAADEGRVMPRIIGGRYGLSSKEFTPAMAKAVLDSMSEARPRRSFTVGITDDVSGSSLTVEPFSTDRADLRAVFYGLGSDGTVGANKHTTKIVGSLTDLYAQGYFVYDSKKSGSMTVSHLRFSAEPIVSSYLIESADVVAVHQFPLLERVEVLHLARPGAVVLLNSPYGVDGTWDRLPHEVQTTIVERSLSVYVIDAATVARSAGLSGQINTVMQVAFFAVTDLLPIDDAVEAVRDSVRQAYGKRGGPVVEANLAAIDATLASLAALALPSAVTSSHHRRPIVSTGAPEFVRTVTAAMIAGFGDALPVSALPVDGVFPTGTARYEKRALAAELPVWDPEICIDCARCALVCPHAAIRMKIHRPEDRTGAPEALQHKAFRSREHPGLDLVIQVAPQDCTGCGVCVDVCPARSKSEVKHKALDMVPVADLQDRGVYDAELANWDFFLEMGFVEPGLIDPATPKGSQTRTPLFEFSGACNGCGETPYLKLLSQLFGDRALIANATGCSSIYGGNLPTTPWSLDVAGRGPAWANSLFEDNAEFGLGLRLALDRQGANARMLLSELVGEVDPVLCAAIAEIDPSDSCDDATLAGQRALVARLDSALDVLADRCDDIGLRARHLRSITGALVRKNVWIVGGDGWAYDIGAGGLDHVLGSGRDVNILVLDTEVYSNTGGQASKSTPRGAVAKFAAAGKGTAKKDLAAEAQRYGNVYVAQIAIGANDVQAVKAFAEAEAWPGPSLIIAYSTCIAHGIDMRTSMTHQRDAVRSGYWPLFRYKPGGEEHTTPFHLDSNKPNMAVADFLSQEGRFAMLARSDPARSAQLVSLAQRDVEERWRYLSQLAGMERSVPDLATTDGNGASGEPGDGATVTGSVEPGGGT